MLTMHAGTFFSRGLFFVAALIAAPAAISVVYANAVLALVEETEIEFPAINDPSCYLRQAQLFEEKGIIAGLDTSVRSENARYLISKIKELNARHGSALYTIDSVAPRCHQYQPATDNIVVQYPPATGLLLSIFPDGLRVRGLYIAAATFVFAWMALWAAFARTAAMAWATAAFGSFIAIMMNDEALWSLSLPATLILCMLLGYCAVRMADASSPREQNLFAAGSGLLLGLAVNVRIANILLAGGFVVAFAVAYLRSHRRDVLYAMAAFATLLLLGLIPTLAANAINAGSPLSTTYSGANTAAPTTDWRAIVNAARWYFSEDAIGFLSVSGIVLTIWFEVGRHWSSMRNVGYLSIINASNWIVAFAYYFTHTALTSYYLFATSVFSSALVVFAFTAGERRHTFSERFERALRPARITATVLVAIVACVVLGRASMTLIKPQTPSGTVHFDDSAIVWSTLSAGALSYYLHKYAAPLGDSNSYPAFQNEIIAAVASDGRSQYFFSDDEDMRELIEKIRRELPLQLAGRVFGHDVYRLAPGAGAAPPTSR